GAMGLKVSTKGHYGVQAMFDLAQHFGEGPVSLKSIAERQGLSEPYLEQLIAVLRKAGLVKSVRGAQGGYILAREPRDIKVGDIIRVLEGPIAPVESVSQDDPEHSLKFDFSVTKSVWEKVKKSIEEVLDSITLADMLKDAEEAQMAQGYMYYI
uniref:TRANSCRIPTIONAL REGULATOR, BADM/RRF2 FAMILY n=1 Tax=Thermincola potens (strain JR) TaxID=635013 RepID=UPI00045FEBEA|nr:Chain A, Transcriptional Regulator, Badm/rrf2 Family [Thermincola potens JR]4CIC_B Chain B, Transcriptional Regulator, Badm/rrf2 Family [Thermincola potens JR]